jgi:hypothetical protein
MQARQIGRPNPTSQARLQLVLALLAAWNLLSFVLQLTNSGPIEVHDVDGFLGARSLSGSAAVLAVASLYAVRNPVRYRFVIWLAAMEQVVAIFAAGFHLARDDVSLGESWLPILVAAGFLALLASNLPRQTDTIAA